MVSWQAFPSLPPRAPLAFLSHLKLPFPSLSNACHAGYRRSKGKGKGTLGRETTGALRALVRPIHLLTPAKQATRDPRMTSCVGGACEQALPAGSLASQSTPERRSKSREGKTTFDWLLRQCFVHTLKRKRVEQPGTSIRTGTTIED